MGSFGVLARFEIERPYRSLCIILVKASEASFKGRKKTPVVKGKNDKDNVSCECTRAYFLSDEVHIYTAGRGVVEDGRLGRVNLAAVR